MNLLNVESVMGRYSDDSDDDRRRSRSKSRSRSRSSERELTRVYVGDIGMDITRRDVEDAFKPFGSLFEIWLARYPPFFAFVVYKRRRDAEDAVREMHGRY